MQQNQTFECHISFEAITSDSNEDILYNLLNKRNKILKVQVSHILKSLRSTKIAQKDKGLYYIEGWVQKIEARFKVRFKFRNQVFDLKLEMKIRNQAIDKQKRKSYSMFDSIQFINQQNSTLDSIKIFASFLSYTKFHLSDFHLIYMINFFL